MMKKLIVVVAALAACSKHEDKGATKDKPATASPAPSAPAEPPKPAPLPIKAFVELDPATLPFKPAAILDRKPADIAKDLPQYLRKDKSSAAVKAKTAEMMKDMEADMKKMGIDPNKGSSDIEFRLPPTPATTGDATHTIFYNRDDGTVRSYGVWFRSTADEAKEIAKTFDQLWGPNKMIDETLGARTTWFDAKSGIRASTRIEKPDQLDIDYVRYLPLASFFGEPGAKWGFEKDVPLVGATVDQLETTYGKDKIKVDTGGDTATLTLPPTDYAGDTAVTTILMFLDGKKKVREWRVSIPFKEYEPARAEYEAALDAKFGKPKKAPHDHFIYAKKVDVEYSKFTHELDVIVSR